MQRAYAANVTNYIRKMGFEGWSELVGSAQEGKTFGRRGVGGYMAEASLSRIGNE